MRRLTLAALIGALACAPDPLIAQRGEWGVTAGLTAYKRLGATAQADVALWTGEYVRIGPVVRGALFFEPFSMSCPLEVGEGDGGTCDNPIQAMGSLGMRVTTEPRSDGFGMFADAALMPMSFNRGRTTRWGVGAGLRYTGAASIEVEAMAIPESAQVLGYMLFVGIGINRGWGGTQDGD